MARHVKGVLYADYVRMIRAHKHVDWSKHLAEVDLASLGEPVHPRAWYPMERFERFGLAIFAEVALGDVELVRSFGRASIDTMAARGAIRMLVPGDARATLMRFKVYGGELFDFPAVDVTQLVSERASLKVDFRMSDGAEEAACYQAMGFFERLVELAGAESCHASFASTRWGEGPETLLELRWK